MLYLPWLTCPLYKGERSHGCWSLVDSPCDTHHTAHRNNTTPPTTATGTNTTNRHQHMHHCVEHARPCGQPPIPGHPNAPTIARSTGQPQVFLHLQYQAEDSLTREIQKLWRDLVSEPPGETPLCNLENGFHERVGISKLVVTYSWPLNLRNRFTVRDIHCRGKPVAEYLVLASSAAGLCISKNHT